MTDSHFTHDSSNIRVSTVNEPFLYISYLHYIHFLLLLFAFILNAETTYYFYDMLYQHKVAFVKRLKEGGHEMED